MAVVSAHLAPARGWVWWAHTEEAYAQNPERFFRSIPKPSSPAAEVWINPSDKVAIRRAIQLPSDTNFVMQVSQTH
jgi:hypothetical protein